MKMNIQFWVGLILALFSAGLMFFGIWPLALRITIAIIGLALIATSKKKS